MSRIIIVGGSRRGKSTLAQQLHEQTGAPIYCADPASKAKENRPGVTYLIEGLAYAGDGGAADWVAQHWLAMPGAWIIEGHATARALSRWLERTANDTAEWQAQGCPSYPCDLIIVLDRPAVCASTPEQEAQHKGVMTTWRRIAHYFTEITEIRKA